MGLSHFFIVAVIAVVVVFATADPPSWPSRIVAVGLLVLTLIVPRLTDWPYARPAAVFAQVTLAVTLLIYLKFHRYIR